MVKRRSWSAFGRLYSRCFREQDWPVLVRVECDILWGRSDCLTSIGITRSRCVSYRAIRAAVV